MNAQHCLINGEVREHISSSDRGLLYGDGVFETMAVVDGKIPLWTLHLDRLQRGCHGLKMNCPSLEMLEDEIKRLSMDAERAVIKLMLTRGEGGRGYAAPATMLPTRILQRHPWPDIPRTNWDSGVTVIFCDQRLARQPALAGIKHLNRLEQVLARSEWQDPTIQEGLLADTEGNWIEAVSHNVFIVNGDSLCTPDLHYCGVAGVMREYILSILHKRGQDVQISTVRKEQILRADAVFLCNSIHGIWPICELDGNRYPQNDLVCDLRDTVAQLIPYP